MTTYTLTTSPERFDMYVQSNDERSVSLTGALQTAARTGNRWVLTATWRLPSDEYRTLRGELGRLQGVRNRLAIPMSVLGYVIGGAGGGTPLVNGAHSAGATVLAVKGMTLSTTAVLVAGDFLQVGNQLVQAVSDLDSDGSGNGSCSIWPELHKDFSDGATIVYTTAAAGTFIMTSNYSVGSGSFGGDWFGEMTAEFLEDVLA